MEIQQWCHRRSTFIALIVMMVRLVETRTFQLGVLMPTSGEWPIGETVAGAVTVAIDKINTDPSLTSLRSGGHEVSFIWQDTMCDQGYGLGVSVDMFIMTSQSNTPLDGIIGESIITSSLYLYIMTSQSNMPLGGIIGESIITSCLYCL